MLDVWRATAIDRRALAAVRIALGTAILLDITMRMPELAVFHSDNGAAPRALVAAHNPWAVASPFMWTGAPLWTGLLLLALAAAAVALAAGLRTRLTAVACFVLVASLQARNPWVLNAGDTLLTLLLFWAMLLPLDGHVRGPAREVRGLAPAGFMLQAVLVYVVNAIFKLRFGKWTDGGAISYAFVEWYTTPIGAWFTDSPLLPVAGLAWLLLVVAAPLLLIPGRARTWVAWGLIAGHALMALTLELGIFPLVSIASLLVFVPASFWDRIAARWPPVAHHDTHAGPVRWARRPAAVAAGTGMTLTLLWAAASLGAPVPVLRDIAEEHGGGWAMFADPSTSQVWYMALGDDPGIDLLTGAPPSWDTPPDHSSWPSERWHKFSTKVDHNPALADALAAHACSRADEVTLFRVERPIDPRGPDPPAVRAAVATC